MESARCWCAKTRYYCDDQVASIESSETGTRKRTTFLLFVRKLICPCFPPIQIKSRPPRKKLRPLRKASTPVSRSWGSSCVRLCLAEIITSNTTYFTQSVTLLNCAPFGAVRTSCILIKRRDDLASPNTSSTGQFASLRH